MRPTIPTLVLGGLIFTTSSVADEQCATPAGEHRSGAGRDMCDYWRSRGKDSAHVRSCHARRRPPPVFESDYGTAPLPPASLRSVWVDFSSSDDVVAVPRRGLTLRLANDLDVSVYAEVALWIRDGTAHSPVYSRVLLPANTSDNMSIDLAREGSFTRNSSTEVRTMVTFRAMDGLLLHRSAAPLLYAHHSRRRLLAYGFDTMMDVYNGGQPNRPTGSRGQFYDVLPQGGLADYDPPDEIIVPVDQIELCFQYHYQFTDSDMGEDHYTAVDADDQWMRARGIDVDVVAPDQQTISGYVDDNGCVLVPAQDGDWDMTITAKARLPQSGVGNTVTWTGSHNGTMTWNPEVPLGINEGGTRVYVEIPTGVITDVMAATTQTMWRVLELIDLPENVSFTIDTTGYDNDVNCQVACASTTTLYFNTDCDPDGPGWCDPGVSKEKFGVSHEVGHFVQTTLMDANSGLSYNDANNVDILRCTFPFSDGPGGHAMRSLEFSGAAFKEGFAHYIGALAWNIVAEDNDQVDDGADGMFVYYKAEMEPALLKQTDPLGQYGDMAGTGWRISLGLGLYGGGNNWRDVVCGVETPNQRETEMDWLHFLWDLHNDPVGTQPTLEEIIYFFGYPGELSATNTSAQLWNVAVGNPIGPDGFDDRWSDLACLHGVDPLALDVCL